MEKEEMIIDGEEWVKKASVLAQSATAVNTDGLKYVICRGYYCGVHAGFLKEHDGNHVTLVNSRRLWRWKAAQGVSLSAVAKHGINDIALPNVLDEIWLGDVYEVIPATESAMKSIVEAPIREQD